MLRAQEQQKNMFFRGGHGMTFEHGQSIIPEWKNKTQLQVLIDRCKNHLKPVGSLCCKPNEDKIGYWKESVAKAGLTFKTFQSEWGMTVTQFTGVPQKTLQELLDDRHDGEKLNCKDEFLNRNVASYLGEFICRESKKIRISTLECALLYGYTLDEAI